MPALKHDWPLKRRLIVVRHAETAWNRERRYQGQTDVPLSEEGRAQARALRERLARAAELYHHEHCAVISSDLARAVETAEIAFGGGGRVIHREPLLREFRYGVFEGLSRDEIEDRYPGVLAQWNFGPPDFVIPGGEARADVRRRALEAVRAWMTRLAAPHLIIVTHGGVMRQLLRHALTDADERPLDFGNTAVHAIDVTAPAWLYEGSL